MSRCIGEFHSVHSEALQRFLPDLLNTMLSCTTRLKVTSIQLNISTYCLLSIWYYCSEFWQRKWQRKRQESYRHWMRQDTSANISVFRADTLLSLLSAFCLSANLSTPWSTHFTHNFHCEAAIKLLHLRDSSSEKADFGHHPASLYKICLFIKINNIIFKLWKAVMWYYYLFLIYRNLIHVLCNLARIVNALKLPNIKL